MWTRWLRLQATTATSASCRQLSSGSGLKVGRLRVQPPEYSSAVEGAVVLPNASHQGTVILCHGLGDTAEGWLYPVTDMLAPSLPHLKFVLPTAPHMPVTLNGGMSMPAWYDLAGLGSRALEQCDGIDKSMALVQYLVKQEEAAGLTKDQIILAGFSQGAALSLYTALRIPHRFAGVIAMSGYLPKPTAVNAAHVNKETPYLVCHGDEDSMVLAKWGQAAAKAVEGFGVQSVRFNLYEGLAHGANMEELEDVAAWIRSRIPNPKTT